MKKITFLLMALLLIAMPSLAQHYTYYLKCILETDWQKWFNDVK